MKKIPLSDLWQLRMKYLYEMDEEELGIDDYTIRKADRITDSFIRWIFAELLEE